jgi:hypothetical protein
MNCKGFATEGTEDLCGGLRGKQLPVSNAL